MRCNPTYALFAGALIFAQTASGQQIPPAQQLKAPGVEPAAANPAAGQASANAASAPAGAPNVLTLSQAASSAPAASSASAPASAPPNVPPIVENAELATGKNARKLDAAGPRGADLKALPPAPEVVLMRVSYLDNEPRALMKIHGVLRYVQVGSPVLKKVVTSISDDGVCLNPSNKTDNPKKDVKRSAKTGPACAQTISFQTEGQ